MKAPKLCTSAPKVISLFQTWEFHNGLQLGQSLAWDHFLGIKNIKIK